MKAGFVLPWADPRTQLRQAVAAEDAGWDAVFIWESAYHPDSWCQLAAMAGATSSIALGTMLTPLPWRRPWELAAQAATVDQLSGGRVILTVGLGAVETGRAVASDPLDRRTRAELLDEGPIRTPTARCPS
jgi:alkanesulfonate monooxygenase SsuD/methylene tetrahydromethanopterin reductase-like flavin-dependent oxidoreductase (luciferase family)